VQLLQGVMHEYASCFGFGFLNHHFRLMVVIRATYIVVFKWQVGLRVHFGIFQRHLVQAFAEDRGDAFIVHGTNVLGALAGGFETG